jgi:SAM-dependent methyltransferase
MSNDFGTFNKAASSSAAERNKVPIAEAFAPRLRACAPTGGVVVELACGTGQHCAHLSRELPDFVFVPTDLDDTAFDAVRHHVGTSPNVRAPIVVDACDAQWSERVKRVIETDTFDGDKSVAAVLVVNMTHIAPWSATLGALAGAALSRAARRAAFRVRPLQARRRTHLGRQRRFRREPETPKRRVGVQGHRGGDRRGGKSRVRARRNRADAGE